MSRFPVKAASLLEPLFHAGSNLGTKLATGGSGARTGLALSYDTDLRALIVEYQNTATLVFQPHSVTPLSPESLGLAQHMPSGHVHHEAPRAPIPTAPAPAARPMAPQVHIPQRQISAQVSHPVHDRVHGDSKPVSPPKYLPHSQMELQRAATLAASGTIVAGQAAPTAADLGLVVEAPAPTPAPASRKRAPRVPKIDAS